MAAYIKTIKNADGDSIYPQTKTSAVYTGEGVNIERYLKDQVKLLKEQLNAETQRADFLEDCVAEMAAKVYAT